MAEHPMETTFRTALWRQLGAAIDMLENALLACSDSLWRERLWSDPGFASFSDSTASRARRSTGSGKRRRTRAGFSARVENMVRLQPMVGETAESGVAGLASA